MALNHDELLATSVDDLPLRYRDRETMLYAQSIGFGRDPVDLRELPFVYEQGDTLRTVPTMASVLVPDMFPPDLGWDFTHQFARFLASPRRGSYHFPIDFEQPVTLRHHEERSQFSSARVDAVS